MKARRTIVGLGMALLLVGTFTTEAAPPAPAAPPASPASPTPAASGYEAPPVLRAGDLAAADLLQGPHHRVDAEVPTDGLLATFTIRSDFGTFVSTGPGMLRERVGEVRGLAELETMSKSEVFANALAESAKRTGQSIQTAVTNPVETVKGVPAGVGRFFDRVGRAAKTGGQKAQDYTQGGGGAGKSTGEQASDVAGAAGRTTADVLGYQDARRRLAKQVQVDPYTTNPVLSAKLDEMGQAAFVGEFGMRLGTSAVPGAALVNHAAWFTDLVWDTPAGDLRVMVDKKLVAMGAPQDEVDRFLRHPKYTLTLQVALTTGLDALSGARGRAAVLPLALGATSEEQARFITGAVTLLARYQKTVGPIAEVRVAGTVLARDQDGGLIVPAPVDYVAWTERAARFAHRPDLRVAKRGIWLTGQLSPRTAREFAALGWALHPMFLGDPRTASS
jgi:hypothetical protein